MFNDKMLFLFTDNIVLQLSLIWLVFFPSILSSIYWDKHTTLHGSVTDLLLTDDPCWQCQSRKHSTILHSITDENSLIKPSLFFIMNKFRQLPCVQIWNPCQWVQRALLRMLSVPMHQSITPNPLDTSFAPSFFLWTVTLHFLNITRHWSDGIVTSRDSVLNKLS